MLVLEGVLLGLELEARLLKGEDHHLLFKQQVNSSIEKLDGLRGVISCVFHFEHAFQFTGEDISTL